MAPPLKKTHDEWGTPLELFALLDAEFGFDLDAAATADNTLCPRYISAEQDALVTPWEGTRIWCNPPYSQLNAFVRRGCQQAYAGSAKIVVMLIPAYTDPAYWWECIVPYAASIRMLVGRLSYLEHGAKKQSARFPSTVVVFYGARPSPPPTQWRQRRTIEWWNWKKECL